MKSRFSRRKFITISAAAAGLELVPFGAKPVAAANLAEWRGLSLGSVATIRIHHSDPAAGAKLLKRVVSDAHRLEANFSLYRTDSDLCELNRRGVLIGPPAELTDLLGLCDRFWHVTGGVFDPTVQPLWKCYVDHFGASNNPPGGPSVEKRKAALELVGWEKVRFDRDRIVYDRRGMGLTLNGIAQGYITDRVVELLREEGIDSCLVDMGEIRGLGVHPDGRPWAIALEDPSDGAPKGRPIAVVNKAVATSGAAGFRFDAKGQCNHLFHPSTGVCADPERTLTVMTATAVAADALSTAFALMDDERINSVLSRSGGTQAYITTAGGTRALAAVND
jgi:thiamine biosynthesis lipoprotein